MPAVVCENISCGSPPYLLNPVPPSEKPSCLNQYPVRVVSLDASFLAVYTATQFLRRTIPLCGSEPLPSGSEPRHATKGSGFFQLDIVKRFRNNFGTLRPEQQGKPRALQSRHFHLMIGSACHPCREVLLARRRCPSVNAAFCCLAGFASPSMRRPVDVKAHFHFLLSVSLFPFS